MKKTTFFSIKSRWLKTILFYYFLFGCLFSFMETHAQTCNVITANFHEGFETTTLNKTAPDCWTYLFSKGSGYGEGYVVDWHQNSGNNSYSFYLEDDAEIKLISPETDDLGDGTKQLRFSVYLDDHYPTTTIPVLEIYSLDGKTSTATSTLINSIQLTQQYVWSEYIVPLPKTTDDYFAFRIPGKAAGKTYWYGFLDDIYYEDLSPCIFPMNLNVSNITQNDVKVSWAASIATGVTGYEYEIRTAGTPGSGISGLADSGTTTNTYVDIKGLDAATNYTVYVRSVCGATNGIWTTFPIKFSTLCPVFGNFFEGFEKDAEYDVAPMCWTYLNDLSPNNSEAFIDSYRKKTGTNGYYVYRSSGNGNMMLVSPETDNLGNGAKQIRFSVYLDGANPATPTIEIYSLSSNTLTASKTLIETITLSTSKAWEEFTVILPNTTDDYFAFSFPIVQIAKGPYYYLYLDDIYYEDIPLHTLSFQKIDNICNSADEGVATVVVKNGLAPFIYSWSPTGGNNPMATDLKAGDYTVTVTDALKRVVTGVVTITEPDALQSNFITKNITCNSLNDGSITISPTGGKAPYTYIWNTADTSATISNLKPGTYSVIITDENNCTITEDIIIQEPDVLEIETEVSTNVSSYGGSDGGVTPKVIGGTSPYTYSWDNGAITKTLSNIVAGTYILTVTDSNGCIATQSFMIDQPIPLGIKSVVQKNVSCNSGNNGEIQIVAMGGTAPYTYLWSPSGGTNPTATGLTAGTHTVLIIDSENQSYTEKFIISEPAALKAAIFKTDITCNFVSNGKATVNVLGGVAPYTYFWSNGATSATAHNLNVGNYTVTITDANNCKTTASVSITQPSALVITASSTNISCYGQNNGSATVSVTGGVAPYTYVWSNGQTGTTLSGLIPGTYVVTVIDANGCSINQSFTIIEPVFVHPPVAVNQSFCIGQNTTLANVVITGSNIKWYSATTGGALLPVTTVLINGTTYYASQTVGTCESVTRTAVQITLNQATALTTTQLNVCSNTRVQNMTIDGFNYTQLKWYSSATSTVVLPSSQLLATGTYYVSSVTGTCESARQAIQVTVAAVVPVPTASAQVACGNSTLDDLVVVKDPTATLQWYSSLQSMIPLANNTTVSSGTYYVQQVIGNCSSVRIAVPVQVINITTPTMTSITVCEGNTIADLHPSSGSYVWYTDSTTTSALPETFVIKSGVYYIAHEVSGCKSNRVNVMVTVGKRPNTPTGLTTQGFNFSAKVSDLHMNQPNVRWFSSYNDAVKQINQLSPSHLLQHQFTYYGILTGTNSCGSMPTAVTVTLNLSNATLDLAQLKYYPNPADSELNISYIEEITKVEMFTITGQKVLSGNYQSNEVKVDLSRLSSGTYLVKIETAKASQFVKVVKK